MQRLKTSLPASIVPSWNFETHNHSPLLPCESPFWKSPQFSSAATQLVNIKGFITALPIYWVRNENVQIKYPTGLIVENEPPKPAQGAVEDESVADSKSGAAVKVST